MKRNLVALASSDWHTHRFRNFNEGDRRLKNTLNVAAEIAVKAKDRGVPVLFTGDLFHNPKEVENYTMSQTLKMFKEEYEDRGVDFYAISGNHDLSEKSSLGNNSPTHLDSFLHFKRFHKIDWETAWLGEFKFSSANKVILWGIPYLNSEKDLVEAIKLKAQDVEDAGLNILMLHSDIPGAKTAEGMILDDMKYLTLDMLSPWDLVLCGHIHMPQKMGKNVYMLGPPIHQNFGDEGNQFGYWEVYNDASMVFKPLTSYPQFIRGEEKNDGNYYVAPEVVLVDEDVEQGEFNIIHSRKKLATKYCTIKGIKSPSRRRALINILNSTE